MYCCPSYPTLELFVTFGQVYQQTKRASGDEVSPGASTRNIRSSRQSSPEPASTSCHPQGYDRATGRRLVAEAWAGLRTEMWMCLRCTGTSFSVNCCIAHVLGICGTYLPAQLCNCAIDTDKEYHAGEEPVLIS